MTKPDMEALMRFSDRQASKMDELSQRFPDLPPVTLLVMAGDYVSLEQVEPEFLAGSLTFAQAAAMIGSYARFEWVMRMIEQGTVSKKGVFPDLLWLWSSSDPDDTDRRYLDLFKDAVVANGGDYLRDGKKLPLRKGMLRVYRGETLTLKSPALFPKGFAWSLDREVAFKFATGTGTRTRMFGNLYYGEVPVSSVLAYITRRDESEVILTSAAQVRNLKRLTVYPR